MEDMISLEEFNEMWPWVTPSDEELDDMYRDYMKNLRSQPVFAYEDF